VDLVRDVLDNQLIDRRKEKMGKVDGLLLELREGKPPRVAAIEVGVITLARRIHPRLAAPLTRLRRRRGFSWLRSFRIPWSRVLEVGIDVQVDLDAERTPARATERCVKEKLIGRIPGAGS
jgi:hypothetical protein